MNFTRKKTGMKFENFEDLEKYAYELENKIYTALASDIGKIELPFKCNIDIDVSLIEAKEIGGWNKTYIFDKPKINLTWKR